LTKKSTTIVLIVSCGIVQEIGKQIPSGSAKTVDNMAQILLHVQSAKKLRPQKNRGNGEHILQHAKYVICKAKRTYICETLCESFRSLNLYAMAGLGNGSFANTGVIVFNPLPTWE
jgi:hypothetical protein